jgi:hypothetical protein
MVIFSLAISIPVFGADEDSAQKEACSKNTAMEWNIELGRCIGKAAARQTRHDAQDCDALEDINAKKACHMQLATGKTGVTDDPNEAASKVNSLQSRSTIINTANTVVAAINMVAKDSSESKCMSKQIFGITSLGGFLTDIYMKINTKKKLDSLKDKFILDGKDNAYSSQVKALEYLKEEQEVIKKIASQEKKRQMLLMIGYGAAAAVAAVETFENSACYGQEPKKGDETKKPEEPKKPEDPTKPGEPKKPEPKPAEPAPVTGGKVEVADLKPNEPSVTPVDIKYDDYNEFPTKVEGAAVLKSQQNGNYKYNYIDKPDGSIQVISNGKVYEGARTAAGIPVGRGNPIGTMDYSSGTINYSSGSNIKVAEYGVTTNYKLAGSQYSGAAKVNNLSFGTGKK